MDVKDHDRSGSHGPPANNDPSDRKRNRAGNRSSGPAKGKRYPWRVRRRRLPAYGALDLGTNNCRLLVAVPSGSGFRVIDAFSRIVRLGEGLGQSGVLCDEAMNRTIDALHVCAAKLKRHGVKRSRLIATEACRRAGNGAQFLERVKRETGLQLEIVNQETEANLAVSGCAALLDPQSDNVLVFDVGGGSSEFMWLRVRPQPGGADGEAAGGNRGCGVWPSHEIRAWTSLPLGVVTLAEHFGGVDVCPQIFEDMVGFVRPYLEAFEAENQLMPAIRERNVHLLGTSGTVTTIAGLHLKLKRYDRAQVDGCWLTREDGAAVSRKLLEMDYDSRAASPCIGKERADLVLAGCAILEAVMRQWPCERLRVADRGLREGILTRLMNEDGHLRGKARS